MVEASSQSTIQIGDITPEEIRDLTSISVVIPTYGEEPALPGTIEEILSVFPEANKDTLEIVIVHTPKGDSEKINLAISEKYAPFVKVIIEKRKGYGVAYMTGFRAAKKDIIVTLDADLTYPAKIVPNLVAFLVRENLEFINTDRLKVFDVGAFHWSHGFGNKFLTLLMNVLFLTGFKDSQSGMWIFRRDIWSKLDCVGRHWEFSAEIKIEAARKNLRRTEIPIHYRRRTKGESTNGVIEGVKIAIFLLAKRAGLGNHFAVLRS